MHHITFFIIINAVVRKQTFFLLFAFLLSLSLRAQITILDTLVDVGGYRLHFRVLPGKGNPILFEAGSKDDGMVWDEVVDKLSKTCEATIITYDRAGFGKSDKGPSNPNIATDIIGLEMGLKKLGYSQRLLLVSHSYGGFYATLFTARNPGLVMANVFIDANLVPFFTDDYIKQRQVILAPLLDSIRGTNMGLYNQIKALPYNIALLRKTPYSSDVPVVDMVAEYPAFDEENNKRWLACHAAFVHGFANRTTVVAKSCGHYIFRDNPDFVVQTISKAYQAMK